MAKAPTIAEASKEELLKLKNKTTGLGSWQMLGADNQAAINARLAELEALEAKPVSDTKPIDAGSSNNDRLTISEYSTRMSDIIKQLGIYEKDKPAPRPGYTSSWSPDNPYLDGGTARVKARWEQEQTNTYEERQAEAREAIAGDLEKFHSDFKGDYGYNWDDRQALLDIDKAWEYEGDAVSGYSKAWEDLKGTATGDALQGLLDEGYHKPYDQSFDEYDSSIGWGFDKWNQEARHFDDGVRESGYYTAGETDKLGLDLQRVGDTVTGAGTGDDTKDLYRDLYRNAIDWDSYNQQDSMWQKAAQMAREDADLANLANEERVGIFGIDWMNNTDAEGNPYGSFDREDEIRQVNKWMADRGWVMGDESTWNTELLPQNVDPAPQPLDVSDLSPQPLDVSGVTVDPATEPAQGIEPGSILPDDWLDQVGDLFGDYTAGIQDNLSDTFSQGLDSIKDIYSTQFDAQQDVYDQGISALTDQLTGYQGDLTGLQDQLGNLEGQLGHVDTKLEDVNTIQQSLTDIMKDWQEHQIDQGERARAKASYGNLAGRTLNPKVKGVKTLPEIEQPNFFGGFGGARGSFNRKGDRISNLKISNVNTA